jgi:hypothetical protein
VIDWLIPLTRMVFHVSCELWIFYSYPYFFPECKNLEAFSYALFSFSRFSMKYTYVDSQGCVFDSPWPAGFLSGGHLMNQRFLAGLSILSSWLIKYQ